MANLKSSKKDILRSSRKKAANQAVKSSIKTYIKKVKKAMNDGDVETVADAVKRAQKALDKAAQNGVIHKNQAARRKSRIASQAAKAASEQSA